MSDVLSKNPDLEFDCLQPFFYPDEDDFYLCGPDSAPPGEDMWKKFELLPSPVSPSQAELQNDSPSPGQLPFLDDGLSADGDSSDWASELLLLPPESDLSGGPDWGLMQNAGLNLKSIIIHDCMWSGFSTKEKLERAVSEKWGRTVKATDTYQPGTLPASGITGRGEDLSNPATQCVDPAAVFPFPLSNCSGVQAGAFCIVAPSSSAPSAAPSRGNSHSCATSSSSGWDTHSESDYEGDNDGDDEEEEIDVVTVEKRPTSSESMTSFTITVRKRVKSKATQSDLLLKTPAPAHQQHNYAAPSPKVGTEEVVRPPKKPGNEAPKSIVPQAAESSSPLDYDSDYSERKQKHNILERLRRNNLKSRLLALRDHVPELAKKDKAAKIVILKKATDYVYSLRANEEKLLQKKEKLQLRQQQLLKKIEHAKKGEEQEDEEEKEHSKSV
ncbi:N-myc protein-like [Spea bombifrons]|uniref:N-myc protein-like n=1 Tax=Spea bombifrons TaxID=233779 RepID=UPI00234A341C|nr:N-myc protein-like [Spea bombifrons]